MMVDSEAQDDNRLVELVKETGDQAALIELMDRHSGIFHKTLADYLPPSYSSSQKEDVFEEKPTFFYEAIRTYKGERNTKFVTWLANKTRYTLLSRRSDEASRPHLCEYNEAYDGETDLTPDEYLETKDESEQILKLVFDKYGFETYTIFKDKYFGGKENAGKTFSEIAGELGVSPQAIQAKHRTILKFLRRKLA